MGSSSGGGGGGGGMNNNGSNNQQQNTSDGDLLGSMGWASSHNNNTHHQNNQQQSSAPHSVANDDHDIYGFLSSSQSAQSPLQQQPHPNGRQRSATEQMHVSSTKRTLQNKQQMEEKKEMADRELTEAEKERARLAAEE